MVGPTIQDNIFSLLLRFGCHVIALKADISKMYRQFKVTPEEAEFDRVERFSSEPNSGFSSFDPHLWNCLCSILGHQVFSAACGE